MTARTKLELTWIGKDLAPKLEPRILLEDSANSYHAVKRVTPGDNFDNRLIHGDNLLALKALEQEFSERIKCVYIDPPYNTGNAFEHYDDGVEHSLWLQLMRDRLVLLRRLLRRDGFLCCHIDDSEGPYLKVLLDEIFGRPNYVATIYVQVRYADKTLKQDMSFHKQIEYIHIYKKDRDAVPNLPTSEVGLEKYTQYIEETGAFTEVVLGGKNVKIFKPGAYVLSEGPPSEKGLKEIWASGTILDGNSSGRFFRDYLTGRVAEDGLGVLYKVSGIGDDGHGHRYFTGPKRAGATKGKYFQGVPTAQLAGDTQRTSPIENFYDLAGAFGNCRQEGGVEFRSGKKPEVLLRTILSHFSSQGDWVLDSFAGSGTTAAAAHKMGRRWIAVELEDHCLTHIVPRLTRVVDGNDHTGISKDAGWMGGGGFRYFKLAPSLLQKDRWGNWVISSQYNAAMLAEAMCKHEGFRYQPSGEVYWQQGYSTERDFIYVTTQTLTKDQLAHLSAEVGADRTLLICCGAFRAQGANFPNLTIKKIPNAVLSRCEWGKDDYSLAVAELAPDDEPVEPTPGKAGKPAKAKGRAKSAQTLPLFKE